MQVSPNTRFLFIHSKESEFQSFVSKLLTKRSDGIYITFSKPADEIINIQGPFSSKLLILDAVSSCGKCMDKDNILFLPFPGDLTGVMMAISRTLKMHRFKYLFLDSLNSLFNYNDEKTVVRFLYALASLCKNYNIKLVIFSTSPLPGVDSVLNSIGVKSLKLN